MSDTIQTVRWRLDSSSDTAEHVWLPSGRQHPFELLGESIRRTGIESRLRNSFQHTNPIWYGLWINSPLSKTQCQLLSILFADLAILAPSCRERLEPFIEALNRCVSASEQLHVELSPPGHVDMGWVTTFVHCPRCKAEGPFEQWQDNYPTEPIHCPTCGFSYSPAATYSSEPDYFAEAVECVSCHTSHRVKGFSDEDIRILEDYHNYREACTELAWLHRVSAFYKRHPKYEDRIKPHALMVLESDDPEVREQMFAGVPFDEISLSAEECPVDPDWSNEDREVVAYLRQHHFSLHPRMTSVQESIDRLKPIVATKSVLCPTCGSALQ